MHFCEFENPARHATVVTAFDICFLGVGDDNEDGFFQVLRGEILMKFQSGGADTLRLPDTGEEHKEK